MSLPPQEQWVAAQGGQVAALDRAGFDRVRRLAEREAGLSIPDTKQAMVQSRLSRRLRATGAPGFGAYLDLVEGPEGAAERGHMVSALTTNVSHFFREDHHFQTFAQDVIPELRARAAQGAPVRIWSAGCSTGQEPYSIAMTLLSIWPEAGAADLRILASDIDRAVLDRARAGTFEHRQTGQVPDHLSRRFFEPDGAETVTVTDDLKNLIAFRHLNLLAEWPMRQPFDVIFCRNVMIYFAEARQRQLWPRFRDSLRPGGWLFLGHSERVSEPETLELTNVGVTAYRKTAPAETGSTNTPKDRDRRHGAA